MRVGINQMIYAFEGNKVGVNWFGSIGEDWHGTLSAHQIVSVETVSELARTAQRRQT